MTAALAPFQHLAAQVTGCTGELCETGLPKVAAGNDQIANILQLVFMAIGIVALIYIVITGLRLITSLGNPEALKQARQSIIYAAVGLAVSLSAQLVIILVLKKL